MKPLRVLICAGEVSGDMHAATLVRALREKIPLELRGFGGDALRAGGAELLYHTNQTAVMGFVPVLLRARFFGAMLRRMRREIETWRPDLLLTVDYPGMNLRLAEHARGLGVTTIHYICPQVWAWHRSRIPKIARILDLLLCLFPFEPACFDGTGLRAVFAGHPLVDRMAETRAEPPPNLPWHGARHRVALLPGSRAGEIQRCLPKMLAAARLLEDRLRREALGTVSFVLPSPTDAMAALAEKILRRASARPTHCGVLRANARHVLLQANAAAVASGTATLEACLARCPTVLVYEINPLTAFVMRRVVTVQFAGLANILAGREVMPELLQSNFTAPRLAEHLYAYVASPATCHGVRAEYDAVSATLGPGRAAETAAARILEALDVTHARSVPFCGGGPTCAKTQVPSSNRVIV